MHWLTGDWRTCLGEPWLSIALAVAAAGFGAVVGFEREKREKPVGTRTLTLVSLGSAVFTMMSLAVGGPNGDHGRIAAQVVSGVGFFGAGAIIRGKFGITGLTTAAAMWAVAAIGMVVGAGYVGGGLGLSALVVAVLTIISAAEQRLLGRCHYVEAVVVFQPDGGKTLIRIQEILDEYGVPSARNGFIANADGPLTSRLPITFCHRHRTHREFLAALAELKEITEIRTASVR